MAMASSRPGPRRTNPFEARPITQSYLGDAKPKPAPKKAG
jgi:hypothetical protein